MGNCCRSGRTHGGTGTAAVVNIKTAGEGETNTASAAGSGHRGDSGSARGGGEQGPESLRGDLLPWQRGLANNNRHGDSFAFARVHGSKDGLDSPPGADSDAERRPSLMTLFAECEGYNVYHRLSAVSGTSCSDCSCAVAVVRLR